MALKSMSIKKLQRLRRPSWPTREHDFPESYLLATFRAVNSKIVFVNSKFSSKPSAESSPANDVRYAVAQEILCDPDFERFGTVISTYRSPDQSLYPESPPLPKFRFKVTGHAPRPICFASIPGHRSDWVAFCHAFYQFRLSSGLDLASTRSDSSAAKPSDHQRSLPSKRNRALRSRIATTGIPKPPARSGPQSNPSRFDLWVRPLNVVASRQPVMGVTVMRVAVMRGMGLGSREAPDGIGCQGVETTAIMLG